MVIIVATSCPVADMISAIVRIQVSCMNGSATATYPTLVACVRPSAKAVSCSMMSSKQPRDAATVKYRRTSGFSWLSVSPVSAR